MERDSKFNPRKHVLKEKDSIQKPNENYIEVTGNKKIDIENIEKVSGYRVILVGESHDESYFHWFLDKLFNSYKPDYFLTEHLGWETLEGGDKEVEKRLSLIAQGKRDKFFNRYTAKMLKIVENSDTPVIGIDYKPPSGKLEDFLKEVDETPIEKSFIKREARMVEVLKKYYAKGGFILLQVGDTHLRESDEFFENGASPLMKFALAHKDEVAVFRLPKKYQEIH